MIKKTILCFSSTFLEMKINMTMRQYDMSSEMRRKTRSFHSFKKFFCYYIHFLLSFLFISICYESLLNVGKHAEVYIKAYIEVYARVYVKASESQKVLVMRQQDEI